MDLFLDAPHQIEACQNSPFADLLFGFQFIHFKSSFYIPTTFILFVSFHSYKFLFLLYFCSFFNCSRRELGSKICGKKSQNTSFCIFLFIYFSSVCSCFLCLARRCCSPLWVAVRNTRVRLAFTLPRPNHLPHHRWMPEFVSLQYWCSTHCEEKGPRCFWVCRPHIQACTTFFCCLQLTSQLQLTSLLAQKQALSSLQSN